MGLSLVDLAAYLNEAVRLRVTPETAEPLEGTIATQGLSQRVGVILETASGKRIGFAEDDVTVGLVFAVADAGVIPSLLAKRHSIQINDGVTTGDIVRVGNSTFAFAVAPDDAGDVPGYIAVEIADGDGNTAAAGLFAKYNLFPDVATVSLPSADTVLFTHPQIGFEVAASIDAVVEATLSLRDGAANTLLGIPAGAPIAQGDTFDLTFGPVTRVDGRTLDAVIASISVA
jgi:hypothetical protein